MSCLMEVLKSRLCAGYIRTKNQNNKVKKKRYLIKYKNLQDTLKVNVKISFCDKYKELPAIVDTGCTNTSVPNCIMNFLQVPVLDTIKMNSVCNSAVCPIYEANLLIDGKIAIEHVKITGLPEPKDENGKVIEIREEMILGMDILNQCDFCISKIGKNQKITIVYPASD